MTKKNSELLLARGQFIDGQQLVKEYLSRIGYGKRFYKQRKTENRRMKTTPTEFKIETGVPIPGWNPEPKKPKYPFAKLKLMQSFFVPTKAAGTPAVAVSACLFAKANKGFKFTCKKAVDKNVKGTRVWRIPVEGKK